MRITSKGQVTIPLEIRRAAGLFPDTEVNFAVENGNVVLRKATGQSAGRGRSLADGLRGRAKSACTTHEIMALTRGDED